MAFSSKAVLTRHEKESHQMHAANMFYCPVETCDRHTRPFPREYNMGDHITRVHRDLDAKAYIKNTKRVSVTSKKSSGSKSKQNGAVRKSAKNKREKLEKQYRQSRGNLGKISFNLPEQHGSEAVKYIAQLEIEFERLKEVSHGLQMLPSND